MHAHLPNVSVEDIICSHTVPENANGLKNLKQLVHSLLCSLTYSGIQPLPRSLLL